MMENIDEPTSRDLVLESIARECAQCVRGYAPRVEEAIEAGGPLVPFYLPAYSPDLHQIEQLFSTLKATPRKIAAYSIKNSAFSIDSLCKAVASCLRDISRSECAAFLANSGYGQPNRETL
jgi:transposase